MSTSSPKQLLRREVKARLASIDAETIATASREACSRLITLPAFATASQIMLYMPLGHELDPALIAFECERLSKGLWLPRTNWELRQMSVAKAPSPSTQAPNSSLITTRHGLREPYPAAATADPVTLDLILVPGLAFDPRGGRLGRGAGFYDRFLADLRHAGGKASFVALALDEQILESVPMDRHDVFMDLIVTPTRTLEARPGNI
jgi:5-formyltetrahydrofolate cyclo-ligase